MNVFQPEHSAITETGESGVECGRVHHRRYQSKKQRMETFDLHLLPNEVEHSQTKSHSLSPQDYKSQDQLAMQLLNLNQLYQSPALRLRLDRIRTAYRLHTERTEYTWIPQTETWPDQPMMENTHGNDKLCHEGEMLLFSIFIPNPTCVIRGVCVTSIRFKFVISVDYL